MRKSVTLTITECAECPHHKVGHSYSMDGFDRGNDWTCEKAKRDLARFIERPSENPKIPDWCPLAIERQAKKTKGKAK